MNMTNATTPWDSIIVATLCIQAVNLAGLLMVVGGKLMANKAILRNGKFSKLIIPSFAAGALLATVVFLLIPESLELFAMGAEEDVHHEEDEDGHEHRFLAEGEGDHNEHDEHEGHSELAWKFGAALLGGFLFPVLLGTLFPNKATEVELPPTESPKDDDIMSEEVTDTQDLKDDGDDEATAEKETASASKCDEDCEMCQDNKKQRNIDISLTASILVGDFFHNFCDGVFVGAAFLSCGSELGWTLTATTMWHEVGQEISDFAMLTHHCGFSSTMALLTNFIAGFSVVLGGIFVAAVDLSNTAIAAILVFSAGVYLFIAAVECMPRCVGALRESTDTGLFLLAFLVGAVPIGLVLLNHDHCDLH